MSVIRFSEELQKVINPFNMLEKGFVTRKIKWLLDWNYQTATELTPWLENQVKNPTTSILLTASLIKNYSNHDRQAIEVLRYVQINLKYKGDQQKWTVGEKWSTADETITAEGNYTVNDQKIFYNKWEGDCEDGAILMYVLCRIKGIPANKLLIMAGDVKGGGHAWLAYRPKEYPLNFAFLDWCYWYNPNVIDKRPLFSVKKKIITEYQNPEYPLIKSNYYKIWIVFNEKLSNTDVKYDFKK